MKKITRAKLGLLTEDEKELFDAIYRYRHFNGEDMRFAPSYPILKKRTGFSMSKLKKLMKHLEELELVEQ